MGSAEELQFGGKVGFDCLFKPQARRTCFPWTPISFAKRAVWLLKAHERLFLYLLDSEFSKDTVCSLCRNSTLILEVEAEATVKTTEKCLTFSAMKQWEKDQANLCFFFFFFSPTRQACEHGGTNIISRWDWCSSHRLKIREGMWLCWLQAGRAQTHEKKEDWNYEGV